MRLRHALWAALLLTGAAAAAPAYTIGPPIPLGPPDRWDYLTFDAASHRVYAAHSTEITVVDVESGKVVGRVAGVSGAHGVVIVPALGRGFAASDDAGGVIVFDTKNFAVVATLKTAAGPDALTYDPQTRRVFVMNGDGNSASAIDAAGNKVIGTVPLGGGPESAASDGKGKIFINMESTKEVVRLDAASLKVEARFPVPDCEAPHGLAVDGETGRVFTTCLNARMLVLDGASGRILATLPIGKGTDAAAFDPGRKQAFSSNGEGTLSVIAETDPDHFTALGEVPTLPGARTMALDAATGRVFLVTADVDGQDPPRRPGGPPRFRYKPGTAKLVVLTPGGS